MDEHVDRVAKRRYGYVLGAVAGWVVDAADDADDRQRFAGLIHPRLGSALAPLWATLTLDSRPSA